MEHRPPSLRCTATNSPGHVVSETSSGELTGSGQIVIEAAGLRPIFEK